MNRWSSISIEKDPFEILLLTHFLKSFFANELVKEVEVSISNKYEFTGASASIVDAFKEIESSGTTANGSGRQVQFHRR